MKTLKIEIPEGKVIDQENSDLSKGRIKFKDSEVENYKDICKKLMEEKYYWISVDEIHEANSSLDCIGNEAKDEQQLEHLLCLNKLINVARYLNDGLKFGESDYFVYYFILENDRVLISMHDAKNTKNANSFLCGKILFYKGNLAEKALKILGEETIRKALTLNF